jgi:hypothetical protein
MKPNKNDNWRVKNLNGTTGLRCSCGSWIKHWFKYTKSARKTCAVVGCMQTASVGAHVISCDKRTDVQWWIAPFCSGHNNWRFTEPVFLKTEIELVSANKKYAGC